MKGGFFGSGKLGLQDGFGFPKSGFRFMACDDRYRVICSGHAIPNARTNRYPVIMVKVLEVI